MYDGVRTFFTQEAKDALHGEIVAVALFTQLYYNKLSEQKEQLKEFMRGMDHQIDDPGRLHGIGTPKIPHHKHHLQSGISPRVEGVI